VVVAAAPVGAAAAVAGPVVAAATAAAAVAVPAVAAATAAAAVAVAATEHPLTDTHLSV